MGSTEPGTVLAGRFVIEQRVGSGGMGAVYRAFDRARAEAVALKLVHAEGDLPRLERFAREADVLSELHHPAIVRHVAHGLTPEGERYLVMEWLEGEDLVQRLARAPLPVDDCVALGERVADALALAHARGILHRDLKPANLFLPGGDVTRAKVLDFGVARRLGAQAVTRTGSAVGSPGYMAPEQVRGARDLGAAADVFALGCVLYECLTGAAAFVSEHVAATLARILFDEPVPVEARRPGLPPELAVLIAQMLRKEPSERVPDMGAVRRALERVPRVTEEAPAAVTPGAVAAAPFGSPGSEQELFSVVLAAPDRGGAEDLAAARALIERLREEGVHAEFLASGALVVTVASQGSATDQAVRAARVARRIRAQWSAAAVSVATGRGVMQGRAAVGEVVDRAAQTLARGSGAQEPERPPSSEASVVVDALSAQLLEGRFVKHARADGNFWLGDEQSLDEARLLLGRPTPCVGRETELAMLDAQLAGCIEESASRVVRVLAPPGAGKSRLRHEFLRRLAARGEAVTVLQGRGDMMGAGAPYALVGRVVREACGLRGDEALATQRARVAAEVAAHVSEGERARVTAFVGELCGCPNPAEGRGWLIAAREDPRILREQVCRAFVEWLDGRGRAAERAGGAVLLVLDDLHWGDAASLELVGEALRALRERPWMVLALGRPEVKTTFPKLWAGCRVQELALPELGRKACERLVQQVLGRDVAPDVVARVVSQSAGNALFLEELIRAAGDGDLGAQPDTVLAMLQARLGRLEPAARRVARAASVFGQTFWVEGVARVLGQAHGAEGVERGLGALVDAEVIEAHPTSRLTGQEEYGFRHALVRDAAWSLMLEGDRVAGHRQAGLFLEHAGERDAMILAEHAERGGDRARALVFFARAAEESLDRYDLDGALARTERAIGCEPEGADLGRLRAVQSVARTWSNRWDVAYALGEQALELLPPGDAWWCRAIHDMLIVAANLPTAEAMHRLAERVAAVDPARASPVPYARAVATLVMQLGILGDGVRSRRFLPAAQRACEALAADSAPAARAYLDVCRACQTLFVEPDPWLALQYARQGSACFREAEDWRSLMVGELVCSLSEGELGDIPGGVATLREMSAVGERLREPFITAICRTYALYLHGCNPGEENEPAANLLIAELSDAPIPGVRAIAQTATARFALYHDDPATAAAAARAAVSDLPIIVPLRLTALSTLSDALRRLGSAAESCAVAREGLALIAREGGTGFAEVPTRLVASEAFQAAGEGERARAELRETVRQIELRADRVVDPVCRERYLTRNPFCVRALELADAWGVRP